MERIEFHIRGAACSLLCFQYAVLAARTWVKHPRHWILPFLMTSSSFPNVSSLISVRIWRILICKLAWRVNICEKEPVLYWIGKDEKVKSRELRIPTRFVEPYISNYMISLVLDPLVLVPAYSGTIPERYQRWSKIAQMTTSCRNLIPRSWKACWNKWKEVHA